MKSKILLSAILLIFFFADAVVSEVIYSIDFADVKENSAEEWLETNEFTFKLDADDLKYRFENDALWIYNEGDINGLLYKEIDIKKVKRIRIEWGVNRYSEGIDWENGLKRDPIMIIISFGRKKISSGSFIIPDVPYFIGMFLGEKEIDKKPYKGNYYKKGGRYICTPCNSPVGKTVITDLEIHDRFLALFDEKEVPPISAISIETDTRDLKQPSEAYIKKIEFLSN